MSKFDQLTEKLARGTGKRKISNPAGLAYKIGVEKYGKAKMAAKAAAGRAKAK